MVDQAVTQSAQPGTNAFVLRSDDLEPVEHAVAGLPLEAARLSGGPGHVSLVALQLPSLSLAVGSFDFPVMTRGEPLLDTGTLAIPLANGDGSWNGVTLDTSTLWSYAHGAEHEGNAAYPPRWAAISVAAERWPHLHDGGVALVRGEKVERLGRVISDVADTLEAGLLHEELLQGLDSELIEAVEDAVAGNPIDEPHSRTSASLVAECIELVMAAEHTPRVADLAEALGVSDRWIRAAFHSEFGVSPSSFFRFRNLYRVHRDLRCADPRSSSVTDVAMRWGFWHLGRFSAAYRDCFGELPSATLARNA